MKKLSILLLSLGLCACSGSNTVSGNNQITSDTRTVSGFDEVSLSGAYQLNINTNCAFNLKVTGDSNLLSYVQTQVKGDTLSIFTQKDTDLRLTQPIVVDLCLPKLSEFSASGANTINLNVQNQKETDLEVNTSGSNTLNLQGEMNNLKLESDGDSNINGKNAMVHHADLESNGNSQTSITVLQSLKIDASGNSSIKYYGSPTSVKISSTGSSSVNQGQ